MAIAFDNATNVVNTSATSVTDSHTATGSNLVAIVDTYVDTGDNLTSLTYDGADILANQIAKIQLPGAGYMYMHYYVNPPTGAKNVSAGISGGATRIELAVATYTGCSQTGVPDASNTGSAASGTSLSVSVTTIADNTWDVGFFTLNLKTATAGTNTTIRINGSGSQLSVITDSNTAQTPAGAFVQAVSWTGSNLNAGIVASLAPPGATSAIKTIDGLAKASVKTVDGLAIASVKTFNGLA